MDQWQRIAESMKFRRAEIPLVCNVSGELLDADRILDGDYWGQHLRQAVQFADSVSTLAEFGCDVVVELGPQPILTGMAATCWPGTRPAMIPLCDTIRTTPNRFSVRWRSCTRMVRRQTLPLWNRPSIASGSSCQPIRFSENAIGDPPSHRRVKPSEIRSIRCWVAKQQLAGVSDETRYENHLAPDNPRWLDDHKVFGDIVFPGAGYVEMGLAATAGTSRLA